MNDRYLFKAKRNNWRKLPKEDWWVQGCLIIDEQDENKYFIGYVSGTNEDGTAHDFDVIEVDLNSICRSTGLKDKEKNLIWENDIVKCQDIIGKVGWNETHLAFTVLVNSNGNMQYYYMDESLGEDIEVIDSIIDNPELLEVE